MSNTCKRGHEWPGNPETCAHCRGRVPHTWLIGPNKLAPPPAPVQCIYLGPTTGETVTCSGCRGGKGVHLKLFSCALHGECTMTTPVGGRACCSRCPDRRTEIIPAAASILITGGIGDILALESLMTDEDRTSLQEVILACPAQDQIESILKSLPFPNLKTIRRIQLNSGVVIRYKSQLEALNDLKLPQTSDWSIQVIFPQRSYSYSSIVDTTLTDLPPVPNPYAVIVPASGWGRWPDRNFNLTDWSTVLDFLDRSGLSGIVIGAERVSIPKHERLFDYQGTTNILQSIELVKKAQAYLGIDTWASVLAAKVLPTHRLAIKSVWPHCYEWKHIYFAPHKEFPFLNSTLKVLHD